MRELFDSVTLNRMLSALIMMFVTTFIWGWLNEYGLPINLLLCAGIITITFDVADFSQDPKPGSLLLGSVVVPFWPALRFFTR
jgi:hypothetical protein